MPRHIPFDLTASQASAAHATRMQARKAMEVAEGRAVVVGTDSEGVERTFEARIDKISGENSSERLILETSEGWKSLHTYKVSKVII